MKVAQMRVKSQRRRSLSVSMISRKLKFSSAARGALGGRRAWMKAFSLSESHLAVGGTKVTVLENRLLWKKVMGTYSQEAGT